MSVNKIVYKDSVYKDFKKIDHNRFRVMDTLEHELSKDPKAGKPLKGNYNGLYSLRVGDYRVIYAIITDGVLVLKVAHRKEAYRE